MTVPFLTDVAVAECPDGDRFDLSTDEFDPSFLTPFSTTLPPFSGSGINVTKHQQQQTLYLQINLRLTFRNKR
jgi:hypothetical protein